MQETFWLTAKVKTYLGDNKWRAIGGRKRIKDLWAEPLHAKTLTRARAGKLISYQNSNISEHNLIGYLSNG